MLALFLSLFLAMPTFLAAISPSKENLFDVVVYGATGAGAVAAIAASRSGSRSVLLLSTNQHVGGMLTGGLQHTDSANATVIQGIAREFFIRTELQYPGRPTDPSYPPEHSPPGWLFESHVGEHVLNQMLSEANVTVVRGVKAVRTVVSAKGVISSITTENNQEFSGRVWVDASYEGEVAEKLATMTWGREAVKTYNETAAGRQKTVSIGSPVNAFWDNKSGAVLPHVYSGPVVGVGEADMWIEPYDFRLCFTDSPGNQVPITQPASYNTTEWELWRRLYTKKPPKNLAAAGLGCLGPIPNNYSDCGSRQCSKCDMLGMNHGTDWTNGAWQYPNASWSERQRIWRKHIEYTRGLLWFWKQDLSVPLAVREEISQYGHCSDEYDKDSDPPHWPHQLYVREAKRLVGDWVWTEHALDANKSSRSVGLGSYNFDCHFVSRLVDPTTSLVVKEGRVKVKQEQPALSGVLMDQAFVMPYDAMLPQESEVKNLLVPVALSASHVRYNAVRMEPTWMILGHAAGVAAVLAVTDTSCIVNAVNVTHLQGVLVQQKQMLWP